MNTRRPDAVLPAHPAASQAAEPAAEAVLARLAAVIESRKGTDPGSSYVARLLARAPDSVLKKIGEEATETVMAAKDSRMNQLDPKYQQLLVGEMADLWFHCLVALSRFNLRPEDVLAELKRREGTSGIAEKASRKT